MLLVLGLVLAACSDPAVPTPQAQFTSGADDADTAAGLDDTALAEDVTTDVWVEPADLPVLADAPVADDVADSATPEDVFVLPDVLPPLDVPVVADVPTTPDSVMPPDVAPPVDIVALPDVQLAVCGDGVCTPGLESEANCAADCAPPTWAGCVAIPCSGALATCKASSGCANVLACAASCTTASCVQACATSISYNTLSGWLKPVVTCAINAGCLGSFDPGPGGGPNSCGNGACDGGETHLTCPKDCGFPVSANEQCQVQNCPNSYAACAGDKACVAAATCYNQYGNVWGCASTNQAAYALNTLIQCIYSQCK